MSNPVKEIFTYTKAIIRPIPEYCSLLWNYVNNKERTIRINTNPYLYELVFSYFRHPVKIIDNIYLGNILNASNYEQIKHYKFDTIFNMTAEHKCYFKNEFKYYQLVVSDISKAKLGSHFDILVDKLKDSVDNKRNILVHCHHGRSRSVALITGYLMKYHKHSFISAYALIKSKKDIVNINVDFVTQLKQLYE
jgi:protein-tyrosine phosphatase